MSLNPTKHEQGAINALRGNPDFEVVVEWIKRRQQQHLLDSMVIKDEALLRWSQGRAQELEDVLRLVARRD